MVSDTLPEYIRYLLKGDAFPHPSPGIHLIQTHISYIIVAGTYVYKWKKPVDFGFLDFSSLEKRKLYCQRELDLNRRLCPDIYLGLVTVTADALGYHLANHSDKSHSSICEYGVKMVRLPEARMMNRVMAAGGLVASHLAQIVTTLVAFYQQVPSSPAIAANGSIEAIAATLQENFDQTASFVGGSALTRPQFRIIQDYAFDFLNREPIFADRVRGGHIRDCHGDLHSGNICLAENVYIFDCIEFNDRFRFIDVAADLAFLAMDIDFHGLPEMADHCVDLFVACSGDVGLKTVLNFYKCYRAYVRGKIMLLTAADSAVCRKVVSTSLAQAQRYFALAEQYART